jgi:hypothetical protein
MSEKPHMEAFERMVDRVLSYKPPKVRKKQKKRQVKKKSKSKDSK